MQYHSVGGTFEQAGPAGGAVGHFWSVRRDRFHRFDPSAWLCIRLHAPASRCLPGSDQVGGTQAPRQSHYGQYTIDPDVVVAQVQHLMFKS